ncbi:preprotein translocase subunit SecG [Gammaproteobacteria bacterium]
MRTILMFVHIAVSLALIGLVLLQHGRGADAGAAFGSGSSQTLFGARGSSSFLTRATAILAAVFFTTSLTLAYLSGQLHQRQSVTDLMGPASTAAQPADSSSQPKNPAESMDLPTSQVPVPLSAKDSGKGKESGAVTSVIPTPVAPVEKVVVHDLPVNPGVPVQAAVPPGDSISGAPITSGPVTVAEPVVSSPAESAPVASDSLARVPAVEQPVSAPEAAAEVPPSSSTSERSSKDSVAK